MFQIFKIRGKRFEYSNIIRSPKFSNPNPNIRDSRKKIRIRIESEYIRSSLICKKYNHNQLQTEDITLILILGMGITRRKPVALTRNLVTLWRRRTSAPTPPPPTPWPRPSLVFKLEKIPDCPARARCSLFKYQPLDIQ